jgi:hypothetical protein
VSVNPSLLASEIATAVGHPGNVTVQIQGFATGILQELTQNGHATVGAPSGNAISGMTGYSMASKVATAAGYGFVSTPLLHFCNGVTTHILTGTVNYTGPIPPAIPPWFLGGTIVGLSGPAMAALVQSNVGFPFTSSYLLAMCTAITSHIMTNAQVTSGTIS